MDHHTHQNPWRRLGNALLAVSALALLLSACTGLGKEAALSQATPSSIKLEKIGSFSHTGGAGSAEITAYDPLSKRLFVINGALGTVDVLSLSNPAAPTQLATVGSSTFGPGMGGVNSVAVFNGVVAIAVEAMPKTNLGKVVFLRADNLAVVGTTTVGALPDMLTFTPDGKHLLVANEGEPNSYGAPDSVDPEGSISIIEVSGLSPTTSKLELTHTIAGFTAFNSQAASLRAAGVRIFGPGASVAQDLEPEYIAVSADSKSAYITLQENNAIAVVNIASKTVTAIRPLGLKDHSLPGMGLDVSNEDGTLNSNTGTPAILIKPYPVKGMYMPDAIASYQVDGKTYLITANEGDSREYPGINAAGRDDLRVREYCTAGLDPTVFTDAGTLILDSNLGRLRIAALPNGGRNAKNAAGQCNELLAFGARSFSIWNTDINRVFDSGDQLEVRTAALHPGIAFNASHDNNTFDDRSPSKGPEPEGVAVLTLGKKTFAFIGLERVGGVMVYDVTNPTAPSYVDYINTRTGATGDRGPEGLTVIPAAQSPNGQPLLIVGNEVSGTTAIFQIQLKM